VTTTTDRVGLAVVRSAAGLRAGDIFGEPAGDNPVPTVGTLVKTTGAVVLGAGVGLLVGSLLG
jgi:hypothetical protein